MEEIIEDLTVQMACAVQVQATIGRLKIMVGIKFISVKRNV